jgi:hypothetical protein
MRNLLLILVIFFTGCQHREEFFESETKKLEVSENNISLFSIYPKSGRWKLSKNNKELNSDGWLYLTGRPANSPFGYNLKIGMGKYNSSAYGLKEILISHQKKDYTSYLHFYTQSDFYSPQRMKERNQKGNGGSLVSWNGYTCMFKWLESKFAPDIDIPIYHGDLFCPLVKDGAIHTFVISYRSAIPPDYYEQNKEYVDEFLNRLGKENLPSFLMQNIIDEFSGIEFYGKVSQRYSDILNPEKLWDSIHYEERARIALQKYRKDNGFEIHPYKVTKNLAVYTEINGSIFIGRGYSDLVWKDGKTVKGPSHVNAEADLLSQLKNKNVNVADQEIVFYSDLGMCSKKNMCNDIFQLVKELGLKKLTVKDFKAGTRVYK